MSIKPDNRKNKLKSPLRVDFFSVGFHFLSQKLHLMYPPVETGIRNDESN